MKRHLLSRLVCIAVAALGSSVAAQPNNEEFARRQYESGLSFLRNHRDTEAIRDLQAVVDSFSTSLVADNALLEIASYQLETAHDLEAAQEAVDKLVKGYPDTDSAPMAHVLAGRIAFSFNRTSGLDAALASFERVPRLFPGNEAVAAAGFYAGETLRTARRHADALERYRRVAMEFPRSLWAARAFVSAGYSLVQQDRPLQALQDIQRARRLFPNSPVATEALHLNSIIYRLYLRGPSQPSHTFSGRTIGTPNNTLRDVNRMVVDTDGRLLVGHKAGVSIFTADGAVAETITSVNASSFFIDDQNRFVVARRGSLIPGRAGAIVFSGPGSDGMLRAVTDIPTVLANDRGEWLVSNPKAHNVIRALPNGRFLSVFAQGNVTRMTQNWIGDVAMLDRSSKSIVVVDRDGKAVAKIPPKGAGYEFADPVDVAFDALNHVYVLDPGRSSIFVFGAKGTPVATLAIPDRSPGALSRAQSLGVDPAGRLYAFDTRSRRIQVYQ